SQTKRTRHLALLTWRLRANPSRFLLFQPTLSRQSHPRSRGENTGPGGPCLRTDYAACRRSVSDSAKILTKSGLIQVGGFSTLPSLSLWISPSGQSLDRFACWIASRTGPRSTPRA